MKRVPLARQGGRSSTSIEFLAGSIYPAINRRGSLSLSLSLSLGIIVQRVTKGVRATPGSGKTMEEVYRMADTRGILYRPPITPSYRLSRCKPYLQRNRVLLVRLNAWNAVLLLLLRGDCSARWMVQQLVKSARWMGLKLGRMDPWCVIQCARWRIMGWYWEGRVRRNWEATFFLLFQFDGNWYDSRYMYRIESFWWVTILLCDI